MSNNLFFPSMIKIIINLKDNGNTVHQQVKECKMFWSQVKKSFNLLCIYNFVIPEEKPGVRRYNLTEDGKKLRDYLCSAHYLINKNKQQFEVEMYGYKSKDELITEVKKDFVSTEGSISATTTS